MKNLVRRRNAQKNYFFETLGFRCIGSGKPSHKLTILTIHVFHIYEKGTEGYTVSSKTNHEIGQNRSWPFIASFVLIIWSSQFPFWRLLPQIDCSKPKLPKIFSKLLSSLSVICLPKSGILLFSDLMQPLEMQQMHCCSQLMLVERL